MSQLVKEYYHDVMQNRGDYRAKNLFLMTDISSTLYLVSLYILFVKFIGPKFMENRKPMNLRNEIFIYNIFQIVFSAYIFYESFTLDWYKNYFHCQSVDYTGSPNSNRLLRANYLYFLAKFSEFLDTIFFVLRKKNNQITFLHIYHHATMPLNAWVLTKYYGGGSMIMIPNINSFIHVVMYLYYLLAGLGPNIQKYLWWKKYLTALQLVQFSVGIIHFTIILLKKSENCNIPKIVIFIYWIEAIIFFLLFSVFYSKSYVKQKEIKQMEHQK